MRFIASIFLIAISFTFAKADGIKFFKGTFEEALALAKAEDKVIFIDAYAVWCGPCKRMASQVFPDKEVGQFYNRYFVNLKMDMERGEGLELRKKYPVSAFPTLFYIDGDGEVVQKVKGAQNVENFIKIGKKVLQLTDKSEEYAAAYEKGERDPKLIYNYVKSLNKAGKPSLKVSNDYLREQDDLKSEFNLRFLYEANVDADSKVFETFIEYRDQIAKYYSETEIQDRILAACQATVQKAIDFEFPELMETAVEKMEAHYSAEAEEFEIRSKMRYALAMKNAEGYIDAAKDLVKKVIKKDKEAQHDLALDIMKNFENDRDAMEEAEDIAEDAADDSGEYHYYITYAHILKRNGKKEKALEAAEEAKELASKISPRDVRMVEAFMRKLQEG